MSVLGWIVLGGLMMAVISLVGGITLVFAEETLQRFLLPLVALAAGTLLGGAFFHLLPMSIDNGSEHLGTFIWLAAGFIGFFVLEQFLHWHHCHTVGAEHRQPLGYLLLVADGIHNLVGGLAVGGAFLVDIGAGIAAWSAAAAHELPQELGDFGILIQGGWSVKGALAWNFASALTFLAGGLVAYGISQSVDVSFLVPFAAGNFIYIAAADLIPEVREHEDWQVNVLHLTALLTGTGLMAGLHVLLH